MELAQLVVFVRPPDVGTAKTRLGPSLGERGAAELYEAFVEDTVRLCRRIHASGHADVALWYAGPEDARARAWVDAAQGSLHRQPEGDLGDRLTAAFDDGLSSYERVVVIGSDAPTLPVGLVASAFDALEDADLMLGPSRDGGYYAIGASGGRVPSFDGVRWSTPKAFGDTEKANPSAKLAVTSPWYDIDEPRDLELLRTHLSLDPLSAPATAERLARLDGRPVARQR